MVILLEFKYFQGYPEAGGPEVPNPVCHNRLRGKDGLLEWLRRVVPA
jgi:hypothetical protein